MKKFYLCKLCLIAFGALLAIQSVFAGNCLITGTEAIGDCGNVNFKKVKIAVVERRENLSGNYEKVIVKSGAMLNFSGNADLIIAEDGAVVNASGNKDVVEALNADVRLSGNTDSLIIEGGKAQVSGSIDVILMQDSTVTLSGVADMVGGKGVLKVEKGAILNKKYFDKPRVINY